MRTFAFFLLGWLASNVQWVLYSKWVLRKYKREGKLWPTPRT